MSRIKSQTEGCSQLTETIAAVATPAGRGGVGIVRLSGLGVKKITAQLFGQLPPPREALYRPFYAADGSTIDTGIVLYFPAPHSFTGEDVLELQGHGGPVVLDMVLARVVEMGARLARPGEFSERAFLNDKLDLAQAEAVADLIDSTTREAARSAMRSLQGVFSEQIHTLVEQLIQLRINVESAIDFPEEELDFLSDSSISDQLTTIMSELKGLLLATQQGCLLREGVSVVIAGLPNVGKSSLLNALSQRSSAIVTDIAGTTRDTLREEINIDGLPLHIIDTAGLRESEDPIEQIGITRAWQTIKAADRLLFLVDDSHGVTAQSQAIIETLPKGLPLTLIRNKIDLSGRPAGCNPGFWGEELALSAATGEGIELLRRHLKESVGYRSGSEGNFIARRRHIDALEQTERLLRHGEIGLQQRAGELLAEDLRQAQRVLGEITGEFSSDDLLGRIFSSFCIGK